MLLSTGHSHHWYMNVLTSQSHTTYLSISPSSLKEGDRNTKFFHCIANSHRRCNTIDRLMVDEELSTDQGIIEGCITHFYRQLYSKNEVHRPLLDEVVFSRISEEDATWLDRSFDEDEVFGEVHDFNGDKAPGTDGFTMTFFQSC